MSSVAKLPVHASVSCKLPRLWPKQTYFAPWLKSPSNVTTSDRSWKSQLILRSRMAATLSSRCREGIRRSYLTMFIYRVMTTR